MRISLTEASQRLLQGDIVAVPTETVYGLAACIHRVDAIERIFLLKGRPQNNPLIIHVADRNELDDYVSDFPEGFEALAQTFWPGPLTCILPILESSVPFIVRSGLPTAGFRMPSLPVTHELLKLTGPLVMPSANLSGKPSATKAEHVEEDFGKDFPVLNLGGESVLKGLESTIVLFHEKRWVIGRLGALSAEALAPVLGYCPEVLEKRESSRPLCPGQMYRHYAPRATLLLGELQDLSKAQFVLGFRERDYPADKNVLLLGSLSDPDEVAENLYDRLRQLDQENALTAWVDMDFPQEGIWKTIFERLQRASEPIH